MRQFYIKELNKLPNVFPNSGSGGTPGARSMGGIRSKWYIENERLIVKASAINSRGGYYMEHLVEIFGSHLSEYLGIDVIHQEQCDLIHIDETLITPGVYSKNFNGPYDKDFSMLKLLEEDGSSFEEYTSLQEWDKINTIIHSLSKRLGKAEAFQYISDMCLIDFLISNPDRHIKNYGLIKERNSDFSFRRWRPMPLFDFGQGLASVNPNITPFTSLDLYSAYTVTNSSAIEFETMFDYFEEHWRYALREIQYSGFPLSVLKGIHPQGVNYFTESCRRLGIRVK